MKWDAKKYSVLNRMRRWRFFAYKCQINVNQQPSNPVLLYIPGREEFQFSLVGLVWAYPQALANSVLRMLPIGAEMVYFDTVYDPYQCKNLLFVRKRSWPGNLFWNFAFDWGITFGYMTDIFTIHGLNENCHCVLISRTIVS